MEAAKAFSSTPATFNHRAPEMSEVRAFTARVSGRVQGVAFRWSAQRAARKLGLTGWVRNEPDGSVSCWAEGPEVSLRMFATWLQSGPPMAHVERFDLDWVELQGLSDDFEITC